MVRGVVGVAVAMEMRVVSLLRPHLISLIISLSLASRAASSASNIYLFISLPFTF